MQSFSVHFCPASLFIFGRLYFVRALPESAVYGTGYFIQVCLKIMSDSQKTNVALLLVVHRAALRVE